MANGHHQTEHAEFKRLGHPDRLADHIASSMGAALLEMDGNARFDIQCKVHYGPLEGLSVAYDQPATIVTLFGQISTKTTNAEYGKAFDLKVRELFRKVGYNGSSGSSPEDVLLLRSFNSQSEDIAGGIVKNGKPSGAGDATIAHGYANSSTGSGLFVAHALVQSLVHRIDWAFRSGILNGLEADGKVQAEVGFEGKEVPRAKTIIVAAQHSEGTDLVRFKKAITGLVRSANDTLFDAGGNLLNLIRKDTEIIVNGAGRFVKGGPLADTGVNGRMDTLYVSGGTQPHGGGLFFGRDGTKTDVSCLLEARSIALHLVNGGFADEAKVTLGYAIGATAPSSVSTVLFGKGSEAFSQADVSSAIKAAFDLSPDGIAAHLSLRPCDYASFAREGLFGTKPNGTHRWETIEREKIGILKQHLKRRATVFMGSPVKAALVR
jgi:S-adenosylmethionine synthetase